MGFGIRILFILVITLSLISGVAAQQMEYSPDGETLAVNWTIDFAVGDDFSQFIFFDIKGGKIKSTFNAFETPNSLIFSPDSKTLAIGERLLLEKVGINASGKLAILENSVSIENMAIDRKFQDEINADFLGLALSADGKTLYKLFPNFLNVYTFPDLKFQPDKSRSIKLNPAGGAQNHFIGISRDGLIVVESEYQGANSAFVVKETGKAPFKISLPKIKDGDEFPRLSVTISRSNETLMLKSIDDTSINSQLSFWNLKTGAPLGVFSFQLLYKNNKNNFYPLDAVAISPDGKKAAARFKAVDEQSQEVTMVAIYDIAAKTSKAIKVKNEDGLLFAESIIFSPDSKQLATFSTALMPGALAPCIEIWDVETGKLIRQFQ